MVKKKIKEKNNLIFRILKGIISVFSVILLILTLSIFYFLAIISVEDKSFLIVTNKVEKYINRNIQDSGNIKIKEVSLGLDAFYKLKIGLKNINLNLKDNDLFISNIDTEFSIFNMLLNNFVPTKIAIFDGKIEISSKHASKNTKQDNFKKDSFVKELWSLFSLLNKDRIKIKELEFGDINLYFQSRGKIINSVKNLRSKSFLNKENNQLIIQTNNMFILNNDTIDTEFSANCYFDVNDSLSCDAGISNIIPDNIIKILNYNNSILLSLKTRLSVDFNLEIDNNYKINSFLFNVNANKGSFYYKDLLKDKIDFRDLFITGEASNSLKDIELSELKAIFDDKIKFTMSLNMKDVNHPNLEKTNLHFKASNLPGEKISKFWPVFLAPNIRDWIEDHIYGGFVNDAYVNISLYKNKNILALSDIDSHILFSDLNLKYHSNMPEISNIDGIASFTKDNMNIDIISADVLDSKIKSGKIVIDNFKTKNRPLKINGSVFGKGGDLLYHALFKDSHNLEKYINGKANTEFNVQIPLKNNLAFSDIYIKVDSVVDSVNSLYFKDDSSLLINFVKSFNKDSFNLKLDLANSLIDIDIINIKKEKDIDSILTLDIELFDDQIFLSNIDWSISSSNIKSDIIFNQNPFELTKLIVQNNFNNDYSLYYESDKKESLLNIELNGKYLDLNSLLNHKSSDGIDIVKLDNYNNIRLISKIEKIDLLNDNYLNNFNIHIDCIEADCSDSFIKSGMNKVEKIEIDLFKKSRKSKSTDIYGEASNISLLARSLGITNQLIGGSIAINAKILSEKDKSGRIVEGKVKFDDKFYIVKNDIFAKILEGELNNLDKLDLPRSDKYTINKLNLDFVFNDGIITISDFLARTNFIGFTLNGDLNLITQEINLNGLIIPGYTINNLFGIGSIPVLGKIITGEKGGGIFASSYSYTKKQDDQKGVFNINKASTIVPGSLRNIFNLF